MCHSLALVNVIAGVLVREWCSQGCWFVNGARWGAGCEWFDVNKRGCGGLNGLCCIVVRRVVIG